MSLSYWTSYKGSQVAKLFHQLCSHFFSCIILSMQWDGGLLGGTSAAGTAEQELQKKDFFPFLVFLFSNQHLSTQITDHGCFNSTGVSLCDLLLIVWSHCCNTLSLLHKPLFSLHHMNHMVQDRQGWWKTRGNWLPHKRHLLNCRYS